MSTGGLPRGTLGTASVRYDFDRETYDRLRAAYVRAVDRGYDAPFSVFAINYCEQELSVTVDGEPVAPFRAPGEDP